MVRTEYCKHLELIENYEEAKADDFKGWDIHHRLETHNSDGERRLVDISRAELIALGIYYNRPPEELIFMKSEEHKTLHQKGKPLSDEARRKNSEAHKGKHRSEETRRKISEAKKGHKISDETKRKISEAKKGHTSPAKGKHWKMSDETSRKITETMQSKQNK